MGEKYKRKQRASKIWPRIWGTSSIFTCYILKQKSSNDAGLGVTPKKAESVTPKMLAVTPVTPILSQVLQGVLRL